MRIQKKTIFIILITILSIILSSYLWKHITLPYKENGIIGASAGSLFVFKGPYKAVLINYPNSQTKNIIYKKINYEHKK